VLLGALAGVALLWVATAIATLMAARRTASCRMLVSRVEAIMCVAPADFSGGPVHRQQAMRLLDSESTSSVARALAAVRMPLDVERVFSARMIAACGEARLVAAASEHHTEAGRWRRVRALRTLALGGAPTGLDLLEQASTSDDREFVAAVVTLLGLVGDRRAAKLLLGLLTSGRVPGSRVAAQLDRFPIAVVDEIWPLRRHGDAAVRRWGAVLLRRYGSRDDVAEALQTLAVDSDPYVRKAALTSLAAAGGAVAVRTAERALADPVGVVRAHAALALRALEAVETAWQVATLLGDREWIVRSAARRTLESFGPSAAWSVIPALSSGDAFERHGAEAILNRATRPATLA
jgi:hypothetical protein